MMKSPIFRFIASLYVSLLISASSVNAAGKQECINPEAGCPTEEDPNCPSRPHIIRCAGKYLDTNQNRLLERVELENAIDGLSFFSRGILKVIGSVDKIMAKCDGKSNYHLLSYRLCPSLLKHISHFDLSVHSYSPDSRW